MNIYLDTNCFSRLKPLEQHNCYLDIIKTHSRTNDYFFSRAHISDLLNDKTDTKYQDLSLISEITKNKYLLKSFPNPIIIYNETPLNAFNYELSELNNEIDLSDFENNPMLMTIIESIKDTLSSIDVSKIDLSLLPPETQKYISNILEQKNGFNFKKLMQNGLSYQAALNTSKAEYKALRSLIMSHKDHFFNDNNVSLQKNDIDTIFESSSFSMDFIAFVNTNITVPVLNEDERRYHQFLGSYNVLNSMGLDSESNKKAKFRNTFNDSLHAYYASFCDLFITDDQGVIEKSNIIYKVFKTKTEVLTSEKFYEMIEKKKS